MKLFLLDYILLDCVCNVRYYIIKTIIIAVLPSKKIVITKLLNKENNNYNPT